MAIMTKKNNVMQIEYINPHELIPYEKNAKKHSGEQIQKIIQSIRRFKFRNPILAMREGKIIVAGHARTEAAKRLNLTEVPVIFLNDMTYDEAKMYCIADNKLAELATWDNDILHEVFADMDLKDIELTGFDPGEFGTLETEPDDFILEDFIFDDVKEPCWFVLRCDLTEYHRLREQIDRLEAAGLVIEDSQAAQAK